MKNKPIIALVICILVYFALWVLTPKATFLAAAGDVLFNAFRASHGLVKAVLGVCCFVLTAAPTIAFMAVQIGIIYFFAKLKLKLWQSLLGVVLCLGLVFALLNILIWQLHLHHYPNTRQMVFIMAHYNGLLKMPMSLLTMLAAASIGYGVSIFVKDKNLLLPVVMFAAYIDFWTVTRGPVHTMVERIPDVASAVSAPIPHAGIGVFRPDTMIGPGDFLFMALVFAVVHRMAMRGKRNYLFVCIAMTLGMLAVTFNFLPFLPGLIVLAVAVVAANWREFKLSREEKISTAIVGLLLAASLPLVWALLKPKTGEAPTRPKPAVTSPAKRN
ncbi:MAG: hypothetical protein NT018_09505 [Armatimonadetes bacterium]|nr:hypothetical protein [Armatimonadota bacterium]